MMMMSEIILFICLSGFNTILFLFVCVDLFYFLFSRMMVIVGFMYLVLFVFFLSFFCL